MYLVLDKLCSITATVVVVFYILSRTLVVGHFQKLVWWANF